MTTFTIMFLNAKQLLEKTLPHNKINYDAILNAMVSSWQAAQIRPKLLIHSCCAPCSTYVLAFLADHADITLYFANSNIHPRVEYEHRSLVQQKFIRDFNARTSHNVGFLEAPYRPAEFIKAVSDLRDEPEGGKRCHLCYKMRLDLVAIKAKELDFDYFASTLTLSPKKNSQKINELGLEIQEIVAVNYLPSDFKKNNGYQQSIQLCKEYGVYRQCYCGCIFAAKEHGIDFKQITVNARAAISQLTEPK